MIRTAFRSVLCVVAALEVFVGFTPTAWSQARWRPSVNAAPLTAFQDLVPPGATRRYETTNLSPGCDPVLHVWDAAAGVELAMNDDVASASRAARITLTNISSAPVTWTVILRAATNTTRGTADLVRDRLAFRRRAVGGTTLDVPDGPGLRHETVDVVGGGDAAVLLGLSTTGHVVAVDTRGSGVGSMAAISSTPDTAIIIAGSPASLSTSATSTRSRRYALMSSRTAAGADVDGDGLDDLVEVALRSCSAMGSCPYPATMVATDTDHDGLSDGAEVLGIEGTNGEPAVRLPHWGSDPLHKDVFVEMDRRADVPAIETFEAMSQAERQAWIDIPVTTYGEGDATDLGNPDGGDGLNIHVDLGVWCPATAGTSCGDFGGGGTVVPAFLAGTTTPTRHTDAMSSASNFAANRRKVFHYSLLLPSGGNGGGDHLEGFFTDTGGAGANGPRVFIHELGHGLGLGHGGHPAWDEAGISFNGKMNYHSIMNYGFDGYTRFSQGTSGAVLNAASARESGAVAGPCDNPSLSSQVGGNPTFFTADDVTCSIDFNRDGVFTGELGPPFARAPIRWTTWNADHALSSEFVDQYPDPVSGGVYEGTPALVRLDAGASSRLYLFALMRVGALSIMHYRVSESSGLVAGGCPNGDQIRARTSGGAGCATWGPWRRVVVPGSIESLSAAAWGSSLVVAYRTSQQQLRVIRSTRLNAVGTVAMWTEPESLGDALTPGTEVELSVVPVDPAATGGASYELWLTYLRTGTIGSTSKTLFRNRRTSVTPPVWQSERVLVDTTGRFVDGAIGADISPWPSVEVLPDFADTATACGAFPDDAGVVRIMCLLRGDINRRWQVIEAFPLDANGNSTRPTTRVKPALQFHVERQTSGAPLFADARGQFWLAVVPPGAPCADCLNPPDILISDPISNLLDPLTATWSFPNMIRGKWGTMWSLAAGDPGVALPASAGSGVVLLEDLHLGAMKGAWVEHLAPNAAGTRPDRDLRFVPLADGSLNHDLHDGNDFRVMEWGVCRSIQPNPVICGADFATLWGY